MTDTTTTDDVATDVEPVADATPDLAAQEKQARSACATTPASRLEARLTGT